jgi:hypothetical protein
MTTLNIDRSNRILMNGVLDKIKQMDEQIEKGKAVSAAAKAFAQSERERVYIKHGKEDRKEIVKEG